MAISSRSRANICLNTQVTNKSQSKPEEVEIRRAPKIVPWMLTGAVFGLLLAFVLFVLIPENQRSSENILGLLMLSLGSLFGGVGVSLAIILDLVTARKVKRALAERVAE
jgi:hypothetical protein